MNTASLIDKSRDGQALTREELVYTLSLAPHSPESLSLMAEAARVSREVSDGRAEVHSQLALNLAPCPGNCMFCPCCWHTRPCDP